LLHAGNSVDGSFSTFTVWTGHSDYVTTRGRGVVMQDGSLCREGERWGFYAPYDTDERAPWEAWRAGLERIETAHHTYYFEPDSDFAADAAWVPAWQHDRYLHALATLEVEPLDAPIATYFYPDAATKGAVSSRRR